MPKYETPEWERFKRAYWWVFSYNWALQHTGSRRQARRARMRCALWARSSDRFRAHTPPHHESPTGRTLCPTDRTRACHDLPPRNMRFRELIQNTTVVRRYEV